MRLSDLKQFNEHQMLQIYWGIKHGLTEKQIELYARPEYSEHQMRLMREAIESGVDEELLTLLAKNMDTDKANEIQKSLIAFTKGKITEEELNYILSRKTTVLMRQVRAGLLSGLTLEQVKLYGDSKYRYHEPELMYLRELIRGGADPALIKYLTENLFEKHEMKQIVINWGQENKFLPEGTPMNPN